MDIISYKATDQTEGVGPTLYDALDPRQERFIELYLNPDSPSFGNCYQSALNAGYTHETAKNLTHNRPKWLSEKLGQMKVMEPEHLVLKLAQIINNPDELTQNKLRAINMLMKHSRMFNEPEIHGSFRLNIQSVLD